MVNRRKVLRAIIPTLAVFSAGFTYIGYRQSKCPLSGEGICQGPCSAFLDKNGDWFCDRLNISQVLAEEIAPTATEITVNSDASPSATATVPSVSTNKAATATASPTATTAPTNTATAQSVTTVKTSCPRGLVNDPYPGRCRKYVDKNGNGICDYSESA